MSKDKDPSGLDQHEPGAKLDGGKIKAGLVDDFGLALLAIAEVGTYGANKYSRGGWQHVEDGTTRYKDAAGRHRLAGNLTRLDAESGLTHAAHHAWNVLAELELNLRDQKAREDNDAEWEAVLSPVAQDKFEPPIVIGKEVLVYDRYRFAIPLRGVVAKLSSSNEGIQVYLMESNNSHYPVGSMVWVDKAQVRLVPSPKPTDKTGVDCEPIVAQSVGTL